MNLIRSIKSNFRVSKPIKAFNLLGLSISFGVFIILVLYIFNEYTFDSYNKNAKNIYLLELNDIQQGGKYPYSPKPMGGYIENQLGEVEGHCTLYEWDAVYSKQKSDESSYNLSLFCVNPTFTELFTLNIIQGNQKPLQGKDKIILSQSAAYRLFGEEDPIGKQIYRDFRDPFIVEAIYEDLPANTTFHSKDGFCSYMASDWEDDWEAWNYHTFLSIPKESNIVGIGEKIQQLDLVKEFFFDDHGNPVYKFSLHNLENLHFDSSLGKGNKQMVNILLVVSILLLFMAFVNYLNFSFADLPKRIKSVGLRKISGGTNRELYIHDFFMAGMFISIAYLIGIILVQNALHLYPDLLGYKIKLVDNIALLLSLYFLLLAIGVILYLLSTGVLAKVEPIKALKGMVPLSIKTGKTKWIFPVFQYVVAISLLAGVLLIYKQLDFIKNYDLGFEKENTLVIKTSKINNQNKDAFASELLKDPSIIDYAYSYFVPGQTWMEWSRSIDGKNVSFKVLPVDERYLNLMGFEVVKGRAFSSNLKADENDFIFNETAVEMFGWQDDILGKKISEFGKEGEVIGVVKDVKYASLYEEVQPMCFWLSSGYQNHLSLKVSGSNMAKTIRYIEEVYSQFDKKFAIDYFFLDESLNQQYQQVEKQGQLIIYAGIVALLIALLGSLGMIIYSCEYRVKEIGVRKANGATIWQIVTLLNRSIILQVLTAFIIALPLTYYALSLWLEDFAYKTDVSWWICPSSGVVVLLIAIVSISWQSRKAAILNPIKALRYE